MILSTLYIMLSILDVISSIKSDRMRHNNGRLDCVEANAQCLGEYHCSSKYRTMRQCVSGKLTVNYTMSMSAAEAQDECRSAMDAMKQSPLYNCKCKRGMKKEKNCLRIYWSIYPSLQGNDLLSVEDSPYEPSSSRLSDIFRLAPMVSGGTGFGRRPKSFTSHSSSSSSSSISLHPRHPRSSELALTRENNCLNAAKACNLNDTCKKYRSAYITPCTTRVSAAEVCNKRKCHKALRQFFDKVPAKHSYGMLFCSCPAGDSAGCSERRRQTIVPICSYEDRDMPNCLALQDTCRTNYICRSRLADFFANCQPESRSVSGCLKESYADCLLAYSGLIGTVMTPNYLRTPTISVSPWCDCSSSGNGKGECDTFTQFFTDNRCLRNAIQAFGNGTDVGVWQPQPPILPTPQNPNTPPRGRDKTSNAIDDPSLTNRLDLGQDAMFRFCGNLQVNGQIPAQKLKSNATLDTSLCVLDDHITSNSIVQKNTAVAPLPTLGLLLLPLLLMLLPLTTSSSLLHLQAPPPPPYASSSSSSYHLL
ncbi:GDNF family receptor alpha-1b [Engraulis encrasicolus]|uniref:GDNF family receptor alpha-1b n=1 Tax=Engraulis encrasicolus TaxID=184585 RepID=UPI002FCF3554